MGNMKSNNYEQFYDENWQTVVQYIAALTGDYEQAQDIAQNAFLKLHQRWETIKSPMAYLYETARSCMALS